MRKNIHPINPLPILAAVVVIVAGAVTLFPKNAEKNTVPTLESQPGEGTSSAGGTDIVIQTADVGTDASYFDYDANGITVQVFTVKASDGTIRLALNTCQVCNGSPYAYFVQDGDWFICQNCGNRFASTEIGIISGGCRPVPITEEIYTEQDGTITIPAAFLEEKAALFKKWKKF